MDGQQNDQPACTLGFHLCSCYPGTRFENGMPVVGWTAPMEGSFSSFLMLAHKTLYRLTSLASLCCLEPLVIVFNQGVHQKSNSVDPSYSSVANQQMSSGGFTGCEICFPPIPKPQRPLFASRPAFRRPDGIRSFASSVGTQKTSLWVGQFVNLDRQVAKTCFAAFPDAKYPQTSQLLGEKDSQLAIQEGF